MTTLLAGSRLANIEPSVYAFVKTHIQTGLGYLVRFSDQGASVALPEVWIEADFVPGVSIGAVMTGAGFLSEQVECFLDINCFQRNASGINPTGIYALSAIADSVRETFATGTAIPVYDYSTSGHPEVGALMVWEMPEIRTIPTVRESGIRQLNVSVSLRYQEIISIS